ncbi:hypothetical protein IAI10_15000 [Clostridium sp. 19966]|uniref:hypothetical protein n=1 Tax=Clostridium sp. 19966 TaxID=2768166 RepID=UPI0028DEC627|nr:hypothetical protein [Clostridium sp. 19966]MDT8717971.1 hypothetical protein [Clostridium sp. 19966]
MENFDSAFQGHNKIKDECLIALKVYDQCRQQDCLTPSILGPSRSAASVNASIGSPAGTPIAPNDIITVPADITNIRVLGDNITIQAINIISVEPKRFTKDGYYDVTIEFVFNYGIQFFAGSTTPVTVYFSDGTTSDHLLAVSRYTKKVTLFGSCTDSVVISSNLFAQNTSTLPNLPYVLVEAKAIPLAETIDTGISGRVVNVTIGLFTIIKLFRLVNLSVLSTGFCKPKSCINVSTNPCEYFNNLDFPFNIFDPPQKEDFCREDEFKHLSDCDEDTD